MRAVLDWLGYLGGVAVLAWMVGYTTTLAVIQVAGL
jgi:hypothetical protein